MSYRYDPNNVFASILRGDVPAVKFTESDHSLAIKDIRSQAPDHILVLSKGAYVTFDDFMARAPAEAIADFFATVHEIIHQFRLSPDQGGGGYRLISNSGEHGFQEVGHFHMHVLGGRWLGPLLPDTGNRKAAEDQFGQKLRNADLTYRA